jgi:hypothetical protein
MIKRIPATMLALAALAAGSVAAQAPGSFDPNTRIYIVRPGDTLWGIAGERLEDNFKWPRIWENNPDVANPHLILPDAQLTIPVTEGDAPVQVAVVPEPAPAPVSETPAAAAPVSAPAPAPAPAPVAEKVQDGGDIVESYDEVFSESRLTIEEKPSVVPARGIYVRLGHEGLIETKSERSPLAILAGQDERNNYATGDLVYLSKGTNGGIEVGSRYEVYSVEREVRHPESGDKLGTWVRVIGILEVIEVDRRTSTARVTYSSDAIMQKHSLRPASERRSIIAARYDESDSPKTGQVVLLQDGLSMAGAWQVVYVDLGERAGIDVGVLLDIDRDQGTRRDPIDGDDLELPTRRIARGVVIERAERTATVLVVESTEDIRVGDVVATTAAR